MTGKTAVVAGAFGVVGQALIAHLEALGDWQVIGLSRRDALNGARAQHIAVDLTDAAASRQALAALPPVDIAFFAAYAPRATFAEEVAPNLAMLVNLVDAVEARSPKLQRIVLTQGSKWYGSHLGPYKTPANEDDPRLPIANFYYAQQDWLAARQQGKGWSWSALRPHAILGHAMGSAMSLLDVIAVYAAISKQLGLPLRFPGKPGAFTALYQMTDARLFARAMLWAATAPACANRAFNLTNGDLVRWCHLWPAIADAFQMPVGPVQTFSLAQAMADKEPLWRDMVQRHGLRSEALLRQLNWRFGDFVFGSDYDHVSNLTQARQAGWCESIDTTQVMVELLRDLRQRRIVP